MAQKLCNATLAALPEAMCAPKYDRSKIAESIVHIGVGGFFRSHLAAYIDHLCREGETKWGIVGCGLLPGDAAMRAALEGQDCLYTLLERGAGEGGAPKATVIGSVLRYVHAFPDPAELVKLIAAPTTKIVSLTVTEGGYPIDSATGKFNGSSPNAAPGSTFSVIAQGLAERMKGCGEPITILCCDNLVANGDAAKASCLGVAATQVNGAALVEWCTKNCGFPNSMVDRITPATSDSDREFVANTHGVSDAWPVACEPFRQWIVEDNFKGPRPALEKLPGVMMTADVAPYEQMKLRLLNAGHSCLAYPSALMKHTFVHDAMADPDVLAFVRCFLDCEAKVALPPVPGMDVPAYIKTLIERFSSPHICDQVSRLCGDGSGKMPKFLLPTVRGQLASGGSIKLCCLLLAAWCEYIRSVKGSDDPLGAAAAAAAESSVAKPSAFLTWGAVFDKELQCNAKLAAEFEAAVKSIREKGIRCALQEAVDCARKANPEGCCDAPVNASCGAATAKVC